MTTPTIQDVVSAQQNALDVAHAFAGMPSTADQLAALQAKVDELTAENASLKGVIDTVKAARQAEEAGEVAADAARKQIDDALA